MFQTTKSMNNSSYLSYSFTYKCMQNNFISETEPDYGHNEIQQHILWFNTINHNTKKFLHVLHKKSGHLSIPPLRPRLCLKLHQRTTSMHKLASINTQGILHWRHAGDRKVGSVNAIVVFHEHQWNRLGSTDIIQIYCKRFLTEKHKILYQKRWRDF